MGTAVNLYTRIHPQGRKAKGLYYGGTESKYAILGERSEVIHDKMEYSLNPRQSSNSAAAQGQTFTTSNLVTGSGTHGNGVSISGISITPSTIEIDANPSSSSTREIRRTVSQVHNAYGVGYTGASCELVFSQGRDYVSSMTLTLGTPSVMPAGGGSVNSCSYTLTVNWVSGKQQTYDSKIPDGATINWTGVTAGSKGTTISNQTTAGTLRCTVSFDGKTASDNATVYQVGNYVTSIDLTGFAIAYSKSVSAAGGTVSPTVTIGTVRFYYSSGSNGTATPSSTYGSLTSGILYSGNADNGFSAPNATTGAMTASNRGTVTGSARNSGTVTATRTVTWTPSGSYNSSGVKSDSMSDSDYATQEANSMESRVYEAPTFSLASSYTFGEDGGSYTISPRNGKQTYTDTYTSGSQSTGSTTLSGTYTYAVQASAAGFSLSGNKVTATKNTVTTARGGFVVRVTLTANGKSSYKDITFSQEAASLNVEGWSISLTYSDIPAGGGRVFPNLSYTFTYVSAGTEHRVTSGAVVSYDYGSGLVSASTLGTTEKSRTLIRTIKVTLSYTLNGQVYTGSTTANVYQEANSMESRVYDEPTFSMESSYEFGEDGGSYTISPTGGKQTYTDTYTSLSDTTGSTTLSGIYTYTVQASAAGFSLRGNKVTATKNTVTTAREGFVVRVTLSANGKSSYKYMTFSQEAASLNPEGWSISLTYSDIPAGGGSVSPNLAYTFTYVSGGTAYHVTSGAVVSYDYNNGIVSASTLGTTEKDRTLIRTIKVTLSYALNGQTYTGSTTANVYQEANSMESRVYDAPTFTMATSYEFGEDGGSYTISPSNGRQTYTDTYTSESQSTGSTTLSGVYSYTTQTAAAGFSRSNNIVTAAKNTVTTARGGFVVRVKLTANGKSSYKDITFSQEAASLNPEGWSISLTYSDIPAGGGSVSPNLTYTFTYVSAGTAYHVTSGAVVSYDYNYGVVSASSLGTTEKSRTLIRTIKVTLSYVLNGQTYTGSTTANVYQEANSMESRVYDAPTFTMATSYEFGEDGGSYTISPTGGRQTYTDTYTSESQSTGSTTLSGVYSYTTQTAAAGFSRTNNIVSVTKNTATTERGGFVVRATLTANGKSSYKDITFSQEAASLNVEGWSISLTYSDIPAGGGSVSPNLAYTFTYVSGGTAHRVTSGAGVSYDYDSGIVSASNLGTTEKSRTLIRTIKVTLSYVLNGQTYTGSTTANVYQEANIATQEYLVKIWGTRGYEDQQTAFSYTFVNGNTSYDGDALGFSPFIWNDHKYASDVSIYLTLAERSSYSSGEIGNYIPLTPSLIRTDNINGTGSLLDAYQMKISFTPNLFPKNLEGDIVISGNDTEEFTIKMTQVRTSYYLFVGGTYTPFDENCECTVSNSFKSDEESYTFKICGDPEGSDGYPDGDPVFVSDSQFELVEQPSWITYRQDDDETIIVTFEENITGSIRNGQLVFGYAQERHGLNPYLSEGGRFKFYVNVAQATQQGVLEISPSTKTITGTGTLQFTVKSSSNWTAELQPAILGGKSPYTYATINPSSGIAGEQLITVNIFDNHEDTSSTAATISRILIVRCENQEGAHDTANITQLGVLHRAYNLCVNRDGYYSCMAGGVASNNPYFEISEAFKPEGDSFKFQIRNMDNGTVLESSEEPTMVLSPSNAGNISYANGEFSVEINEGNVVARDITAKVTYNDEIHSYFNGPYSIEFRQEAYDTNYVYMSIGDTSHLQLFITNDTSGIFNLATVQIGLLLQTTQGQIYEPTITFAPNREEIIFDPAGYYGVTIPKNGEFVISALHVKVTNFNITSVSNPHLGLQIDSALIKRTTTTGELLARFTANPTEYTNPVIDGVCEFYCDNIIEGPKIALDGGYIKLSNTGTIRLHIMN